MKVASLPLNPLANADVVLPERASTLSGLRILFGGFCVEHPGLAQAMRILRKRLDIECRHILVPDAARTRAFNPDVVIVYSSRPHVLRQMVPTLRKLRCPKALWFCDLRGPERIAPTVRGAFQGIFLPWKDRFSDARYGLGDCDVARWQRACRARCWYMPQASELRVVRPRPDATTRVVFIGDCAAACHRGRRALCDTLNAKVLNASSGKLRGQIRLASPALYASSAFSLSCSPPAVGYTSNRSYDVAAWGGLLLLQRYPLCETLFTHGEHALIFDTPEQARSLVQQFGPLSQRRAAIQRASWRLAARKHTWAHRILNICANLRGEESFWGTLDR